MGSDSKLETYADACNQLEATTKIIKDKATIMTNVLKALEARPRSMKVNLDLEPKPGADFSRQVVTLDTGDGKCINKGQWMQLDEVGQLLTTMHRQRKAVEAAYAELPNSVRGMITKRH